MLTDLGTVVYSMLNKSFIQLKVSYVASVYKAFTNNLNSTVVYTITLKEKVVTVSRHSKNWELNVRLKLPPTMLHTKHKVKQGLATVVPLASYFKFT